MLRSVIVICLILFASCNNCRYGCEEGICQRGDCNCFEWYEGDACERPLLEVYEGAYTGQLIHADTVLDTLDFRLRVSESRPESMLLEGEEIAITFEDRSRFEVEEQNWSVYEISGEGEMLLNRLSMRLSLIQDSVMIEASISAQKLP